jgi:hypothetical protein
MRVVMASETPKRVSIWSFHQAPPEFRESFPDGREADWVVFVPQAERQILEPSLLRWRSIYPIRLTELPDRSVVYCGAPREAMRLIAEQGKSAVVQPTDSKDRRAEARIPIACPSRYEVHSEPKEAGTGSTIDISSVGIAFTTQTLLPANAKITLHVEWPIRLVGDVPIELNAGGRLTRTEKTMAAVELDTVSFSISA